MHPDSIKPLYLSRQLLYQQKQVVDQPLSAVCMSLPTYRKDETPDADLCCRRSSRPFPADSRIQRNIDALRPDILVLAGDIQGVGNRTPCSMD
jgi:hypothetical protein